MSYRPLISKFVEAGKLRQLLSSENLMLIRTQLQHNSIKMRRPWNNPSILSPQMVKRYWELIPLFVIVGGAVLGLGYAIVRNGLTRDDVRFYSGAKTNSENTEYFGPRKLMVFNQKYEIPKGLKEALAALEEPTDEKEN
ncbi:uncharacterized protein [Eurosta solidaginis]|uniref:uncharacterized protein isoform X1 n=1 Tax=Eurosta solidaginis TaxID=178769 RepID=UPI003530E173